MKNDLKRGFTLIEILIVVGIIAILASIVVVAINPARQFAQANNAQRWSNVNAILNAVHQYSVEHRGALPPNSGLATSSSATDICSGSGSVTCAGMVDLTTDLVPTYIVSIPSDPLAVAGSNNTSYTIASSSGRLIVAAPKAELGTAVSVTR